MFRVGWDKNSLGGISNKGTPDGSPAPGGETKKIKAANKKAEIFNRSLKSRNSPQGL
jgi:hypothetical protein